MNELAKRENIIPALSVGPFVVTRTGLQLARDPTWEEWQAFFDGMQHIEDAIQWNIGDALVHVEIQYGEAANQLTANYQDHEYDKLRQYRWVAQNIKYVNRLTYLSWTHHLQVASLMPKEQKRWLRMAIKKKWSKSQLRNEIKKWQQEQILLNAPEIDIVDENIIWGDALEIDWPIDVDLVLTDPPFGLSVDGRSGARSGKGEWDEKEYAELHEFNKVWINKSIISLKRTGSLIVFGSLHNIFSIGHIMKEVGLYIIRDIVWNKPFVQKAINPSALVPSHEIILWARKGEKHTSNITEITRDIWEVSTDGKYKHPTEKPETLIKKLINMASDPGNLIADPFLGSGTTTAMAKELKRNYWGVEKDEHWWKIAQKRMGH